MSIFVEFALLFWVLGVPYVVEDGVQMRIRGRIENLRSTYVFTILAPHLSTAGGPHGEAFGGIF